VAGHGAQLYDLSTQTATQASLTAGWGRQRFLLAFALPPQAALLVAPLAYLPYRGAYITCELVQLVALVAAVALLVRAEGIAGRVAWLAGAGALATLPVLATLLQAQADGLGLLGLAILRSDWERPTWRSAVAVALLLLKPHLFAVVLLLMLIRRSSALALLAAGAVSVLAGAAAFGPAVWLRWPSLVLPTASGTAEGWLTGHSDRLALGGQLEALGLPAVAVAILLLAAMLAVAVVLARRGPQRPAALAVAVVASVLLSPHLNAHDFVLLLLPGIYVLGRLLQEWSLADALALAAATLALDVLLIVSGGVVVGGVAALGWAAWHRWEPGLVPTGQANAGRFVSEALDRSGSGR